MAKMVQYLDRSESMKVEIEELEYLSAWRRGIRGRHQAHCHASGKKHRRLFHIFCEQGQSEFLVFSAARWDEYSRMRARLEEECQELSKVINDMSEMQGKLLAMMDQRRSLMSEAPEELRKQIFQEIRDVDEKIFGRGAGTVRNG